MDNFPLRSNQRAELCAVKSSVEFLGEAYTNELKSETKTWIIATDSEYVVKGMTEWLPIWRVCPDYLTRASRDTSNRVYRIMAGVPPKVLHQQI